MTKNTRRIKAYRSYDKPYPTMSLDHYTRKKDAFKRPWTRHTGQVTIEETQARARHKKTTEAAATRRVTEVKTKVKSMVPIMRIQQ